MCSWIMASVMTRVTVCHSLSLYAVDLPPFSKVTVLISYCGHAFYKLRVLKYLRRIISYLRENPQFEGSAVHERQGDVVEAIGVLDRDSIAFVEKDKGICSIS